MIRGVMVESIVPCILNTHQALEPGLVLDANLAINAEATSGVRAVRPKRSYINTKTFPA